MMKSLKYTKILAILLGLLLTTSKAFCFDLSAVGVFSLSRYMTLLVLPLPQRSMSGMGRLRHLV
jgi:hypothetical protein